MLLSEHIDNVLDHESSTKRLYHDFIQVKDIYDTFIYVLPKMRWL